MGIWASISDVTVHEREERVVGKRIEHLVEFSGEASRAGFGLVAHPPPTHLPGSMPFSVSHPGVRREGSLSCLLHVLLAGHLEGLHAWPHEPEDRLFIGLLDGDRSLRRRLLIRGALLLPHSLVVLLDRQNALLRVV